MSAWQLILIVAAILLGALVKSVTGVGLPIVAVPVIAAFTSIDDAVIVLAIPNLVANLVLLWRERKHLSAHPDLPVLGLTGVVGGVAGTVVLTRVPEEPLALALVALVLMYIVGAVAAPAFTMPRWVGRRFSPVVGLASGVAQGATGVSGPIVVPWIHAYRLPPDAFVASVALMFTVAGVGQMMAIVAEGVLDADRLLATVAGVVPVLAMVPVGARLRTRLAPEVFERAVLGILALSAVTLVVRVVS